MIGSLVNGTPLVVLQRTEKWFYVAAVIWDQRESGQIRRTFRCRVVTNLVLIDVSDAISLTFPSRLPRDVVCGSVEGLP